MNSQKIIIRGAREHNLKNIDLEIPRNKLVVITGLSGSGKSSLAFDTVYAEGQRKYVESLSAYARQFLEQMQKPEADHIEGLSPAISIEQRRLGANPRSTVATSTEIYDYLRLLFSKVGIPHCYRCGKPITRQSAQEIVDQIMTLPQGTRIHILAPVVKGRKGEYQRVFENIRSEGFVRVRVDGTILDVDEIFGLRKSTKHTIEIVVDRGGVVKKESRKRISDSIETALRTGKGSVIVMTAEPADKEVLYSEHSACAQCGVSYDEFTPRMFSFNSPYGACPTCHGLGTILTLDEILVIPDRNKSLKAGAIAVWQTGGKSLILYYRKVLRALADHYEFGLDVPFEQLDKKIQNVILHGSGEEEIKLGYWRKGKYHRYNKVFEGVLSNIERRYQETESEYMKERLRGFMTMQPCSVCKGARLRPESLAVTVEAKSICDIVRMPIEDAYAFFNTLRFTGYRQKIGAEVVKEVKERLNFLLRVGLGYLTLDRQSSTLSGGEAQRIKLATQIGASLVGVIYVLDEPSIGLHQRDNSRLLETLRRLRDLGNTVIVVEHDEATIRTADHVIDLGPGAGEEGGYVVASGDLASVLSCKESLTGSYLRHELQIKVPAVRKAAEKRKVLEIRGARENNLKNVDIKIPLGLFCCVTGVSGSGKSTLVDEILRKALFRKFYGSKERPGKHDKLLGTNNIDKVILIDQSPIGRTPRSNPATYTGVFDYVRDLYARLPDSKIRGYRPGRYSFNVKGGRCETCRGDGMIKIEMHFLPDVYVQCETCKGKRYNQETLEVKYKGKNIADVLESSVNEALVFFKNIPHIRAKLQTLSDVGMGYIKLGQSSTTLSGGEAQRVKLSTELSKKATGKTLYILDEPTTGLHFADISRLLDVLMRLRDRGNTILVVEHNLDVIKQADYIIDLGPEGGERGGRIVASGTPEEVAQSACSYTGQFLTRILHE